ncbi:MAG TPA: integrase, partial [Cupriavidus sp.]|nr:integrase [Cupriavidus sp.]
MPLTDVEVRSARPRDKAYRLTDGLGMYLEVSPAGGKYWRFKYRFAGKEKRLALGVYPEVSAKEARTRRDDARRLLANGVDPGIERRVQKAASVERAANSFEAVAREWFARQAPGWAASHADKIIGRLENDVFPWLGGRAIAEI